MDYDSLSLEHDQSSYFPSPMGSKYSSSDNIKLSDQNQAHKHHIEDEAQESDSSAAQGSADVLKQLLADQSCDVAFAYKIDIDSQDAYIAPLQNFRNQDGSLQDYYDLDNVSSSQQFTSPALSRSVTKKARSEPGSHHSTQSLDCRDATVSKSPDGDENSEPKTIDVLPLEIYGLILRNLSNSDAKRMRLTCKAIEHSVSSFLFHAVVAPFNADVFGMLKDEQQDVGGAVRPQSAGKSKIESSRAGKNNTCLAVDNRKAPLDVFRGFGSHIRHFGMTFDFEEADLRNPARKVLQEGYGAYWGNYQWPYPEYTRFADRADMEDAADETSVMTSAFSYLSEVTDLALSVNSGLGRIGYHDWSIRSELLHRATRMFAERRFLVDSVTVAQRKIWCALTDTYTRDEGVSPLMTAELVRFPTVDALTLAKPGTSPVWQQLNRRILRNACLPTSKVASTNDSGQSHESTRLPEREQAFIDGLTAIGAPEGRFWAGESDETGFSFEGTGQEASPIKAPTMNLNESSADESQDGAEESNEGILYTRDWLKKEFRTRTKKLNPLNLDQHQREWLMETVWAQDAFLSSYMLAIVDNPSTFQNVRRLSLSCLSSRYVTKLFREDFWDSLPHLDCFEIIVLPEWRDVKRDAAHVAQTSAVFPSRAGINFYHLLQTVIGRIETIKELKFGWALGGEHQEGLWARNEYLLPAVVTTPAAALTKQPKTILNLPHVESITITNAWISPNAFKKFINVHARRKHFKAFTFDSVSLTCYPKPPPPADHMPPAIHPLPPVPQIDYYHDSTSEDDSDNDDNGEEGLSLDDGPDLRTVGLLPAFVESLGQGVGPDLQAGLAALYQQPTPPSRETLSALRDHLQRQQQRDPAQAPPAAPAPPVASRRSINWRNPATRYRVGSWSALLHSIRKSCLRNAPSHDITLTFLSCGYTSLHNSFLDQRVLDYAAIYRPPSVHLEPLRAAFGTRREALKNLVMDSYDPLLGTIATAMPLGEMNDLETDWGFREGWPDRELLTDVTSIGDGNGRGLDEEEFKWGRWGEETKKAPRFDGCMDGGTGRFSGRIRGFERIEEVV
ncbi:MAG: hypothetical protein M1828_001549 [Chrysothrix sp. TS-e1954]|nr:MAG: hypothetical protein M1828_001549 [Chrysothrix sp. TS-e1954]